MLTALVTILSVNKCEQNKFVTTKLANISLSRGGSFRNTATKLKLNKWPKNVVTTTSLYRPPDPAENPRTSKYHINV